MVVEAGIASRSRPWRALPCAGHSAGARPRLAAAGLATPVLAGLLTAAGLRAAYAAAAAVPTAPSHLVDNDPVTFSVVGDAPYSDDEIPIFLQHLADHNRYSPSEFFVHVGDIFAEGEPCSEPQYQRMGEMLETLAVPAFIIPGDNEWTDCLDPAQAWQYWVTHLLRLEERFCGAPAVERQATRPENFAFTLSGVLFIGINLVGGGNDVGVMQDDSAWVSQQLMNNSTRVRAAVVFSQSGPGSNRHLFFTPFEQAAAAFGKPVLLAHGDGHAWLQDFPFAGAPNVMRVQVDRGILPPLQVTVTSAAQPFEFVRDPWPPGTPVLNLEPCVEAGPDQSLAAVGTAVLHGKADDDGDPSGTLALLWSQVNGPATVSFSYPNSAATTVTFPEAGSYRLRLTADDGDLSEDDELNVSVGTETNLAPVVAGETYGIDEDATLGVPAPGVLANDSDPDGDMLSAWVAVGPTHGILILRVDGSVSYTPDPDYNGGDAFTYWVSDGRGGVATGSVALAIHPVNDPPEARADTLRVDANATLSVAAPGVLGNDTDIEGDAITAVPGAPPAYGTVTLAANGALTYVPNPGFAGWDSFTYQASDGLLTGPPTTVTVGVGISVFRPIADAWVRSNSVKNFGTELTLQARTSSHIFRPYLKFDLQGVGSVRSAVLRLYVLTLTTDAGVVYQVPNWYQGTSNPWLETGIVWSNAPAIAGNPLGAIGAANARSWIEFDVTRAVQHDGAVSFAVASSSPTTVEYSAREGAHPPELVIAAVARGPKEPRQEWSQPDAGGGGAPASYAAAPQAQAGPDGPVHRDGLTAISPIPFQGGTRIEYELAEPGPVTLEIYNVRGARVRIFHSDWQLAGHYTLLWDGRNQTGHALSLGVYFVQAHLGSRRFTHKILLQR